MRFCLSVTIAIIVAASVAPARAQKLLKTQDYAVYSALLDHLYPSYKGELVIAQEIGTSQHVYAYSQLMRGLSDEIRADLQRKIGASTRLERKLQIKPPYMLVSWADCQARQGKKKELAARCADLESSVSLSRVAFNNDGTEALVYVLVKCGKLCGNSTFYLLKRESDQWQVVRVKTVSVS